ncbi:LOW QUALITY PROTEIN: olfactory receptor 2J1-like [Aptenodytes patagonicus]|uniref:LOW QUALITY PROTEIN: olfactory receptor 2J1-like n=1 Tax=Aptenodytes patagonicus TaxID=9234 RepID=UPI003F9FFE4A
MSPKSLQQGNLSSPTIFFLLGFSSAYRAQVTLCLCFSFIYLVTVMGNLLIVTLIWLDAHLHSPMYFFLGHLPFLDICCSSVTLPKIHGDSFSPQKTIYFVGCIMQIYFFLCFGGSKCMLLAAMAYDWYLAICHPLHYLAHMSKKMCHCLVAVLWLSGSFSPLIQAFLTTCLPFCRSSIIDHLFCEMPFLLSCSPNAPLNKAALHALAGTIVMGSFLLILMSYVHMIRAVLQKGAGTQTAFATCTSHLTVVALFFSAGAVAYLVPHSSGSREVDEVLALLYAIVTPMLNPIIYSLRNSEVKGAIRKALRWGLLQMFTKGAGIAAERPPPSPWQGCVMTHRKGSGAPGRAVPHGAGGGTAGSSLLSLTNASNAQTRYWPVGTCELGT